MTKAAGALQYCLLGGSRYAPYTDDRQAVRQPSPRASSTIVDIGAYGCDTRQPCARAVTHYRLRPANSGALF